MRDRESRQGGRQAYHLCVGGHKLRKNQEEEEEEKKGCKINREEAERGKGGGGEKRIRTKMNFRMFQLKKQDQRQSKNSRHGTNQRYRERMLLRCRYGWRSYVADLRWWV